MSRGKTSHLETPKRVRAVQYIIFSNSFRRRDILRLYTKWTQTAASRSSRQLFKKFAMDWYIGALSFQFTEMVKKCVEELLKKVAWIDTWSVSSNP